MVKQDPSVIDLQAPAEQLEQLGQVLVGPWSAAPRVPVVVVVVVVVAAGLELR